MNERKTKFLRNARSIALAWGVRLYNQRKRKAEQLATVAAAVRRDDFPKKSKTGWPFSDVHQWGTIYIELDHERRAITVKPFESKPEIPKVNGHDGGQALLNLSPQELHKAHIESLKRSYAEGKRLSPEEKRLIGVALNDDDDRDEIGGGHEGIAEAIRREFKVECHKAYVSDWLKGKRFPCPGSPPMPASHRSGFHKKSLVFPWYRQYVLKISPGQELPLPQVDYRSRKEKADAERAEIETEDMRRSKSEKYILREVHENTLDAAGLAARNASQDIFEKQLPKKFSDGLSQLVTDEALAVKLKELAITIGRATFDEWQLQLGKRLDELMAETKIPDVTP